MLQKQYTASSEYPAGFRLGPTDNSVPLSTVQMTDWATPLQEHRQQETAQAQE